MTDTPKTEPDNDTADSKICGIVMPISHMSDDYSAAHWARVRSILETAVTKAGFKSKVVWDNPDVDVIQSKILQNIYGNEVIICDLSNLNPNVMLEAGLRLSTKKPTILITDGEKKPPFDIASIEYIPYQRNLEYNSINSFINKLSDKIHDVYESYKSNSYKSFVDSYQFEVAKPTTIEVSGEEYILGQIKEIKSLIIKSIQNKNNGDDSEFINSDKNNIRLRFTYFGSQDELSIILESKKFKKYNFYIIVHSENKYITGEIILEGNTNFDNLKYFKEELLSYSIHTF